MRKTLALLAVAALLPGVARSQVSERRDSSADVYQAIRVNDLARLRNLVRSREEANAAGPLEATPLMTAAFAGTVDAMAFLIEKGADPDAQNPFGTTPLMMAATDLGKVRLLLEHGAKPNIGSKQGRTALFIAAMTDGAAPTVRMLIAHGADVRMRDAFGNTLLTAAAYGNDLETIRIVLEAGVDLHAAGVTGVTPLLGAAYHGNVGAARLLLSKGAKVNAVAQVPTLLPLKGPKSGPLALREVTPLLAAASVGPLELITLLLDAGADINARDGRGMTPLMLAVATNRQNPAAIGLLLQRGADATIKSKAGATAGDWARRVAVPAGLELLKVSKPTDALIPAPAHVSSVDVRTAAERSMTLLETSSQKFFDVSGCVSCHHQNVAGLAAGEMRARGLGVDAKASAARLEMMKAGPPAPLLLERMDIGVPEVLASMLVAMAAENVPPSPVTDMIAANIAATQTLDGSWHIVNGIGERPPTEEGPITRAALCIRVLQVYGSPARAAEITARIARARDWLLAATPVTNEDRNMQLLGLDWAGADPATLKKLAAAILADQQPNGAWRQHSGVPVDAYATGQSLYVLANAGGIAPTDPAYQRGVTYLLTTQQADGSWRVVSRAPKFQAFFNSGFPYAGNQWISAWATGWATMALAQTVPAVQPR